MLNLIKKPPSSLTRCDLTRMRLEDYLAYARVARTLYDRFDDHAAGAPSFSAKYYAHASDPERAKQVFIGSFMGWMNRQYGKHGILDISNNTKRRQIFQILEDFHASLGMSNDAETVVNLQPSHHPAQGPCRTVDEHAHEAAEARYSQQPDASDRTDKRSESPQPATAQNSAGTGQQPHVDIDLTVDDDDDDEGVVEIKGDTVPDRNLEAARVEDVESDEEALQRELDIIGLQEERLTARAERLEVREELLMRKEQALDVEARLKALRRSKVQMAKKTAKVVAKQED